MEAGETESMVSQISQRSRKCVSFLAEPEIQEFYVSDHDEAEDSEDFSGGLAGLVAKRNLRRKNVDEDLTDQNVDVFKQRALSGTMSFGCIAA